MDAPEPKAGVLHKRSEVFIAVGSLDSPLRKLPEASNYGNREGNQGTQHKKNRRQKLLCELLLDFAKNTTLHGLRYITERGLSVVEKVFWIVTFLTSLGICLWLMRNVWTKWQTSPVIVTLSEKLMSVTEVPFPAVTVCPQAKIKQAYYNYTDNMIQYYSLSLTNYSWLTWEERDQKIIVDHPEIRLLEDLALICKDKAYIESNFSVNPNAIQNLQKAFPQIDNIFYQVVWRDNTTYVTNISKGEEYFKPVLTREGQCFTFNGLDDDEILHIKRLKYEYFYSNASNPMKGWSLDRGYFNSSEFSSDAYPRRGKANSANPDLVFNLKEIQDRDTLCDGYNRGFKVYLHHPADLPQSSLSYYSVPPGQIASFAIKINVMNTSDTLKHYSPVIRQCYFPLEKELSFFKIYTLNNCQLECSANYTLKICECVWFHMPHNDSTKLCHHLKKTCVKRALEKYASQEGGDSSVCNCLPSCVSVQYEAEVVKTDYEIYAFNTAARKLIKIIMSNANFTYSEDEEESLERIKTNSKIEMYFKEPRFVSMRRSELFGLTDFLANCGGLLGLFLGFSFLSLVEIFYFFTLRFSCKLRRNKVAKTNEKVADHLKIV